MTSAASAPQARRDHQHQVLAEQEAVVRSAGSHVTRLPVELERLDRGGLRVTSPDLPGWAMIARGPHGLARCVDRAWTELQIAAYAADRGVSYDAEHLADKEAKKPALRAVTHRDGSRRRANWRVGHDPADWTPLPDGRWRSPDGRNFGPHATVVAQVKAARLELGLPVAAVEDEP